MIIHSVAMKDLSEYDRPNTVSGLIAKRKELIKFLANLTAEAKKVQANVRHVDSCIHLFDPDAELPSISPDRYAVRHAAPRGHLKGFILGMFREADPPLSSRQITDAWVVDQHIEADKNTINLLRTRIGICIQSCKRDDLIVQTGADGLCKLWVLKEGGQ